MERKKSILITNDDGVNAKGIKVLVDSLLDLGELVVFAPDGPRSGMSSAITSVAPISYSLVKKERNLTVYSCTGTPTDCIKLALNEVLDRKPDLLISGINHGGNHSISVHYSGTVGAAIEGCIFNIPSLATSLLNHSHDADFKEAARVSRLVALKILEEGLALRTYLNLNIPDISKVKGVAICRQADGCWVNEYNKEASTNGQINYYLAGEFVERDPICSDNDNQMLIKGYATLVPCKIDVTNTEFMPTLKSWKFE